MQFEGISIESSALSLQVWFIVPAASARAFERILRAKAGKAGRGCLAADLFAKGVRPVLTRAQMERLGVRIVIQPPGYTVVILPVHISLSSLR